MEDDISPEPVFCIFKVACATLQEMKSEARIFMVNIASKFKNITRRIFLQRHKYKIGKFEIELTADHMLPTYQAAFPTYDRFLPALCRHLPPGSIFVDVGANVGDTIAAIGSENIDLRFVAVEPDPEFSALLSRNMELMRRLAPKLDVEIVQAFVGDNLNIVGSQGSKGTSRAIISQEKDGSNSTIRLDEILKNRRVDENSLIKIDTDGFDWSVISSGIKEISRCKPIIFFECDLIENGKYVEQYDEILRSLSDCGYNNFYAFDNYGGLIGEFKSARDVSEIFRYIVRQNGNRIHRTMYYIDLMVTCDLNDVYAKKSLFSTKY